MASIGDLVANLSINNADFTSKLKSSRAALSSFAGSVSSIVAPVAGVLAGVWGTSSSISGYKSALEGQRKFQAVLAATGGAAGITAQEMADYASELQSITNFEDDATMGAAAFLASMDNIRGDNFKRAIALSQDMATVMGTDLDGAVKKLGKSFKDLSPEQVTAKLDELQSRFGGAAQAVADPWKQLQNTLGDVGEGIGSVLLPTINVLSESLASVFGVVAGGGESFKSVGIEAAVWLSNIGGSLVLTATQWELFGVQVVEGGKHWFSVALPAYVKWFGDNAGNIVVTFASNALTAFENLGKNIQMVWQQVLNFFSGEPVKFDFTSITDGFINTIEELPDIPDRVVTDIEKNLKASIDAQTESLVTSIDKQREALSAKYSPLSKSIAPTFEEGDGGDSATKQKSMKTDVKAAFKGSSEAASIMLRGIGGKSGEDIAKKQLSTQQKLLDATKANKPVEMFPIEF